MTAIFLSYGLLCMAIGFGLNWLLSWREAKKVESYLNQLENRLRWADFELAKHKESFKVTIQTETPK